MQRPSGRRPEQMRQVRITRSYIKHAEGSVLVEFGDTKVICTASIEKGVPRFLRGSGKGWLTAEYGMLPRSTETRMGREASGGKQGGRTVEIQRLIGRVLRAAVDLTKLGENTLLVDCDVIQADGGTRTAAISGACVAVCDALTAGRERNLFSAQPLRFLIAAVSVGIVDSQAVLDLDYAEDSVAQTDMNVALNQHGDFIEVQGTAEAKPFTGGELDSMMELARVGAQQLTGIQQMALSQPD